MVRRPSDTHVPGEHICRLILNKTVCELEQILRPKGNPYCEHSLSQYWPSKVTVTLRRIPCQRVKVLAHTPAQTPWNKGSISPALCFRKGRCAKQGAQFYSSPKVLRVTLT